jgi:hypothetical protein
MATTLETKTKTATATTSSTGGYEIIDADNIDLLIKKLNTKVGQGWKLHGQKDYIKHPEGNFYRQVIYREPDSTATAIQIGRIADAINKLADNVATVDLTLKAFVAAVDKHTLSHTIIDKT